MNILFLTLSKVNSISDKFIYTDLMREFLNNGHNIYIVSPIERKDKMKTHVIEEGNCKIIKVKIGNVQKTNRLEKGVSTLFLEKNYIAALKKYTKDVVFDLLIYTTPPITLVKTIKYIKERDKAYSYLLLKDIFPQNAVDLNMFSEKSIFYRYFRSKEKKLYKLSDTIGCMSLANVQYVLKHNPQLRKDTIVEVSPNSIEPEILNASEKQRVEIRKKYNIPIDKTVFIYGGNLGKPQGIDYLIDCIEGNRNNTEVFFLIVGSGTELKKLQMYFKSNELENATLLKHIPKKDYEDLANSCDVGLVFLDHRFTIPNFPSRILAYMQASMPILAATDKNTDIGQVIEEGEFGFWCESKSVENFNKKVKLLCNKELRSRMGKNSRDYLIQNYTVKHSYNTIMAHFKEQKEVI